MLRQLSLGPFQDSCFFAEALLDVMAASACTEPSAQLHHPTQPCACCALHSCSTHEAPSLQCREVLVVLLRIVAGRLESAVAIPSMLKVHIGELLAQILHS